jgi:hypothetical protein
MNVSGKIRSVSQQSLWDAIVPLLLLDAWQVKL